MDGSGRMEFTGPVFEVGETGTTLSFGWFEKETGRCSCSEIRDSPE